jgi:hypothetical protein
MRDGERRRGAHAYPVLPEQEHEEELEQPERAPVGTALVTCAELGDAQQLPRAATRCSAGLDDCGPRLSGACADRHARPSRGSRERGETCACHSHKPAPNNMQSQGNAEAREGAGGRGEGGGGRDAWSKTVGWANGYGTAPMTSMISSCDAYLSFVPSQPQARLPSTVGLSQRRRFTVARALH